MIKAYLLTENNILSTTISDKLSKDGIKLFCGNFYDISKLLDDLNKIKPDILIIDMIIENYCVRKEFRDLLKTKMDYDIIVILNNEKYFNLLNSFRENINGFLTIRNDIGELIYAINMVLKEKFYISRNISKYLIRRDHDTNDTNVFFK